MQGNQQFVAALAQFDTPTVANAIEIFGIRDRCEGYVRGGIRACFPELPAIVGFASTITLRGAFPNPPGLEGTSIEAQVESFASLPGSPVVVMEEVDVPPVSAAFGEVMCSTYQNFGAQGLITNGWGRDLPQIRRRQFPVFTSGDCCAHGHSHLMSLGLPVNLFGLVVRQGDVIHADANGVLLVPHEIAPELAEVARRVQLAEQPVLDFVGTGSKDQKQLREARKEMFRQLEVLEAEVRGHRLRSRTG
jgi:regulator of RNase E activity RraA